MPFEGHVLSTVMVTYLNIFELSFGYVTMRPYNAIKVDELIHGEQTKIR